MLHCCLSLFHIPQLQCSLQMLPPSDVDLANLSNMSPYNSPEYINGSLITKLEKAESATVAAQFILHDHLCEGKHASKTDAQFAVCVRNAELQVEVHKHVHSLLRDTMYKDMHHMNGH